MTFPPDAIQINGTATFSIVIQSVKIKDLPDTATILYSRLWTGVTAPTGIVTLECGAAGTPLLWVDKTLISNDAHMSAHCTGLEDLYMEDTTATAVTAYYEVVYVPYDTRLSATTTQTQVVPSPLYGSTTSSVQTFPNYGDFILVSMTLIFLFAFVTWGYFFSIFKTKKHGSY